MMQCSSRQGWSLLFLSAIALAIFILLCSASISCTYRNFARDTAHTFQTNAVEASVDSIIFSRMVQVKIPGLAIGIVKDGSIFYTRGYGTRDINTQAPVSENTMFHTASVSKLFTAEAIMRLVGDGRVSLGDLLLDHLPDLQYTDDRVRRVTVRQMLNHTSGLPDVSDYHWNNHHAEDASLKNYVTGLRLKLKFDPGSRYSYSNLAFDLLGYIIERATGSTFEDFVAGHVLVPSGMVQSDFRYFTIPDSLRTSPHTLTHSRSRPVVRKVYPYTREHAPSSTLNASVRELSLWMNSFLDNLEHESPPFDARQMTLPSFEPYPHIGLGFQLSALDGNQTVGHFGGDPGFRSYLLMLPERRIGIILLANCDYQEDFRQEIVHAIARKLLTR